MIPDLCKIKIVTFAKYFCITYVLSIVCLLFFLLYEKSRVFASNVGFVTSYYFKFMQQIAEAAKE